MTDIVKIKRGVYHDSVALMLVSRAASAIDGVRDAAVVMATPLNLELLTARGFDLAEPGGVTPNDLVVAVRADDAAAGERALARVESELATPPVPELSAHRSAPPVSLRSAARADPDLNLALVSVPAAHAAYESATALESGLHVMCFSSGVTLEQEAALKRRAAELDLLFMGPDCGTAIIHGIGLGFANGVQRGPVGIVGASGTGIQEVCCLLDAANVGISQAIGVGGRDLSARIGGSMFRRALELLARDPDTEVILGVSKPPDQAVARDVMAFASGLGKPVVIALVGLESPAADIASVDVVSGLEAGAARAAELLGRRIPLDTVGELRPGETPGDIRGLYSGGTLCVEAMSIVSGVVGRVRSNIPLQPDWGIVDLDDVDGHAFLDLGAEQLTDGRAHPMIDSTVRLEHFERQASDPTVAVILLDVVLGYGAAPDPAGELAPAIARACAERPELSVIVSVCGTRRDPQGLADQRARLLGARAVVTRSAADAARAALTGCGYEAVPHGER
jgi:FdrA protein